MGSAGIVSRWQCCQVNISANMQIEIMSHSLHQNKYNSKKYVFFDDETTNFMFYLDFFLIDKSNSPNLGGRKMKLVF